MVLGIVMLAVAEAGVLAVESLSTIEKGILMANYKPGVLTVPVNMALQGRST